MSQNINEHFFLHQGHSFPNDSLSTALEGMRINYNFYLL